MQTIRSSLSSPNRGGIDTAVAAASLASCVVQIVQNLRTIMRIWRERQATRWLLRRVDDRMLKDIGLHRSQIDSVAIMPMTDRISHRRRLIAYSSHLATTALDTELKNSTRRGAVIDDRCPGIGDEHTGFPYESHPSDSLSSPIVRAASKRYGLANAPWIDEAIKIRREDLF